MTNDYTLSLNGAYLELTSKCNAKCPYCYNESNNEALDELPLNTVRKIIDEISDSDFPGIVFSGGEPFTYKYIFQVLQYALSKNVKPTIITNGMLLDHKTIKSLLSENISIQLTFDSIIPREHDNLRGDGNFQKILDILTIANELLVTDKLMIRYNISKINYTYIEKFIELLINYNIYSASFSFLHKSGRGKTYPFVFDLYEDSILLYKVLQYFRESKAKHNETDGFNITFGELDNVLGCAYFASRKIKVIPRIDAKGNVFPCQIFTGNENSLGNILYCNSLAEILNSTRCSSVIERIRSRKEKIKSRCSRCPYDTLCMGGCPATAFNSTGNLESIDNQCYFIRYCFKNKQTLLSTNMLN